MSTELENYNPKEHRYRNGQRKALTFRLQDVEDPIGLEIKDPDKIRQLYRRWPLIPYAGTHEQSNDGLLTFFDAAKYVSPTQGACHNSIKSYLFGSKMRIKYSQDPDFELDQEEQEVPSELAKEYAGFIRGIKSNTMDVRKSGCDFYDEMGSNGNIFVELVHTATGEVRESAYYHHPTAHCRFWATEKDQPEMILISEVFDEDYFRRHPPRLIPVFPNYIEYEDGTQRTIIHKKNGNFRYYGRPLSAGGWIDVFGEGKERNYLTKIAANNFTGQGVMEVEDDDVETDGLQRENEDAIDSGFGGIAERFDVNFSADSDDPQTWLFMSRPKGAKPVFIYEFKINTSEGFYKTVGGMHRAAIIENNLWSERLLGNAVSEGFSTDSFVSELRVKEISTLSFYRDYIESTFDIIFTEAARWAMRDDLAELGVEIPTAVESVGRIKNAEFKDLFTAYGTGVRAGALTSTKEDEIFFRQRLGIMPVNQAVDEAWEEDGGYRRPITLKASEESEAEQGGGPGQQANQDE